MIPQLFQPPSHILVCLVPKGLSAYAQSAMCFSLDILADIVDEQRSNGASVAVRRHLSDPTHMHQRILKDVLCGGDGTVALLTSSVPNLRLDSLVVDLNAASSELNADRRLAVLSWRISSPPLLVRHFSCHTRLNSFRVNRESRLDFPTPESPIKTTLKRN